MTTVTLLRNPSPTESSYCWSAKDVDQLTLSNKLSSLPFWFPNHKMKQHQFRMILLKALPPVDATIPGDPFIMILELIPPPSDPSSGVKGVYPGGCSATVTLLREDGSGTKHAQTQAGVINETSVQLCFDKVLLSTALRDPELCADGSSLSFEVSIRTNVSVVAEQVSQSLTGLWSMLSSSVSKVAAQASKTYEEELQRLAEVSKRVSVGQSTPPPGASDSSVPLAPWDVIPSKWSTREEEWKELLIQVLPNDEGTFLSGAEAELPQESKACLLQCGLNPRVISEAYKVFDFDRDVHEGLLTAPALRSQRYHLVPARIKEEVFWANYFWKIACLGHCDTDEQVRILLTVLNSPQPVAVSKQPEALATSGEQQHQQQQQQPEEASVKDAEDSAKLLEEYLRETPVGAVDEALVEAAIATCETQASSVRSLLANSVASGASLSRLAQVLSLLDGQIKKARDVLRQAHSDAPGVTVVTPAEDTSPFPAPAPAPAEGADGSRVAAQGDKDEASMNTAVPGREGVSVAAAVQGETGSGRNDTQSSGIVFPKMPWEEEEGEEGI